MTPMKRFPISFFPVLFLFMIFSFASPSKNSWAGGNDIDLSAFPQVQSQFEDLSKEIGLAVSYIAMAPAEPLGLTGFDIGVEGTFVKIDQDSAYWQAAVSDGNPPGYIAIPKIHVQKGLPFGIDVGATYAAAPGTNVSLIGGEVKWAFLKGTTVTPAAAIRGSYTQLMGVDDLDLQTLGLDASVSKGFGPLTPYAGVGTVQIKAEENAGLGLSDVDTNVTKFFLGAKLSLLLVNVVVQADFSEVPMYSLRFNVGF